MLKQHACHGHHCALALILIITLQCLLRQLEIFYILNTLLLKGLSLRALSIIRLVETTTFMSTYQTGNFNHLNVSVCVSSHSFYGCEQQINSTQANIVKLDL